MSVHPLTDPRTAGQAWERIRDGRDRRRTAWWRRVLTPELGSGDQDWQWLSARQDSSGQWTWAWHRRGLGAGTYLASGVEMSGPAARRAADRAAGAGERR